MKTHPAAGSVLFFSRAGRENGTRVIQMANLGHR